jgi:hypothetical protein
MFVYSTLSKLQGENYATHATPNTELEPFFLKPGTRNIGVQRLVVQGKGAALTALSGIAFRLKKWTSTSASGGTAAVPSPSDPGAQAAKATAGLGTAGGTAVVTVGTGGPTLQVMCGCSGSGPGGWVAANVDDLKTLEGSANMSQDLFVVSPTTSMSYEFQVDHVE